MSGENRLPVQILSGFLGSGKTTLLKRWLQSQVLSDVALLVNEFGTVGIDHLLLGEVAPDTVLLPGGCVCCQIRGELKQALLTLYERRARGELPPFSQVILETTGLADPAPILSTLLHDRQLQYHFRQGALVTLVDAEHAAEQQQHPEWLAQVTAADRLLISKTDRVSAAQVSTLADQLQQLNPLAERLDGTQALTELFRLHYEQGSARQRFRWLGAAPLPGGTAAHASGNHPGTEREHPLTETCVITLEAQISWPAFAVWLSMLLHCHGGSILRMKGILRVQESLTPIAIHGVQHSLHPPLHLSDWPGELPHSQLVFILRGLSAARLEQAFLRFRQAF